MTPLQAIAAATGSAAKSLGLDGTLGTLTVGRAADLVAVDGDPATRIEDVHAVRMVIKGGRTVARDGVVL
jgi:imidazolonepropionase-like amidohydrolase